MQTFRTFPTAQAARDYRHEHGTGGWIFEPEAKPDTLEHFTWTESILFPPDYSPIMIFNHPMTKGRTGQLLSN